MPDKKLRSTAEDNLNGNLETMSNKELLKLYLNRYNNAKNRIKELEIIQEQLENDAEFSSRVDNTSSLRVQNNSLSESTAVFAIRITEIEDRIRMQKQHLSKVVIEILDIFDYLAPESEERSILELKYIRNKTVDDICEARYVSRGKYYMIYDRALSKLLEFKRVDVILEEYRNELSRYRPK